MNGRHGRREPATRHGDDPGVVVPVGRGGIVAMSSALFHRSGPNTTPQPRRAVLVSYSAQPILNPQGGDWNRAVPFLQDGGRVRGDEGEAFGGLSPWL